MNRVIFTLILLIGFACPTFAKHDVTCPIHPEAICYDTGEVSGTTASVEGVNRTV
jgi:nitrite reductase/ring-hydroxylating ferredoxin subunit